MMMMMMTMISHFVTGVLSAASAKEQTNFPYTVRPVAKLGVKLQLPICCSSRDGPFLSRRQTIDKVGQLFGRGLVSEDNRLMKSLNYDTCHSSRHDCDVKKCQTIRTPTLLCCFNFLLRNNIKSGPYGPAVGYAVTGKQFAGPTFHRPIVFGN